MCRSRRSSCVPTTDSWGWSVLFLVFSLKKYFDFLYMFYIWLRKHWNTELSQSYSQNVHKGEACLKFCAGQHSRLSACLLQYTHSSCGLLSVNHPIYNTLYIFFLGLQWCDGFSCGHSDQFSVHARCRMSWNSGKPFPDMWSTDNIQANTLLFNWNYSWECIFLKNCDAREHRVKKQYQEYRFGYLCRVLVIFHPLVYGFSKRC